MLIDLQLHSTYSDGYLTPTDLAGFLSLQGVKVAALTDHNTVAGLDEFRLACKKKDIKAIHGVEIYCQLMHKKFNLLWYNFNDKDPELHNFLRQSQARRRDQVRRSLLKLKTLGLTIDENKILDKYSHYIPLNHVIGDIWQAPENRKKIIELLGKKNPREEELIKYFFKNKKTNKLGECYTDFKQLLAIRKKIGGQLVLNHPGKNDRIDGDLILRLKNLGLNGIEVLSPHHSAKMVMQLQQLARNLRLTMTGGSDYHLDEISPAAIKNVYAYFRVQSRYLGQINKIIG